jgi:hypothetical protein
MSEQYEQGVRDGERNTAMTANFTAVALLMAALPLIAIKAARTESATSTLGVMTDISGGNEMLRATSQPPVLVLRG